MKYLSLSFFFSKLEDQSQNYFGLKIGIGNCLVFQAKPQLILEDVDFFPFSKGKEVINKTGMQNQGRQEEKWSHTHFSFPWGWVFSLFPGGSERGWCQLNSAQSDFSGGTVCVMDSPANAGDAGDVGCIPGSGRSLGVGNGNLLQYSCLGNPTDRGAWRAAVPVVTKCWT